METPEVELLTELMMALLLFADAVPLEFKQVEKDAQMPGRLLLTAFRLVV